MEATTKTPTLDSSPICAIHLTGRFYRMLISAASVLQSPLLLALRLYWGWQFFGAGKGKLINHDKVAEFFQSLHIVFPSLNAYFVGCVECVGGLLLLIGLASRLVCLPLIATLVVAYLTAELDTVKTIFSDPDKFTGAAPFLFLLACVVVLSFGPGKFSVDWILERRFSGRNRSTEH